MINLSQPHLVERMLKEAVFYPAHDHRTESPAYAKVHHHLTKELDLPCLVCGVRNSTLGDPTQNKVGAKALETHHHNLEWALQNAIDLDKFNQKIVAECHKKHPEDPQYNQPFTQQQMLDWIDHSEHNLWVICDVHHRHSMLGIHSVTFPIWNAQDLIMDNFRYITVKEQK